MKKLILVLSGLCFLYTASARAQSFEAVVNRSTLPEGETFVLTLELANAKTQNTPDLSALSDDFTTYSVSNAFRTNIINGKATQSQQWNLVLMPNKAGKLVIPAIKLDDFATQPITLTVAAAGSEINEPAADKAENPANRFALSGQVDTKNPYVQEQILYTLKLLDRGGLQGEEPYFEAGDDWIIKTLGAPVINSQIINGKSIRELVFKYALFPQKSGKLTIPAAKFRGFYLTKDNRSDPFAGFFSDDAFLGGFGMTDIFATKNPIFLSTKPIEIEVKPAAIPNTKWWLPAKELKLFAEFNPKLPTFRTGEAISRDIYLQATGVIDSQLPEITFKETQGLKQYPEKPLIQMKVQDGQVIAFEKITNVYIPNQSGELMLPEISVPWFNVRTNQPEVAKIPAQKILVAEGTAQPSVPQPTALQPEQIPTTEKVVTSLPQVRIYMLLGFAFIFGILLSLILMKILTCCRNNRKHNYGKLVVAAAQDNDLRVLRDALLIWARDRFNDERIFSLNDIAAKLNNNELQCLLDKLNEILYSGAIQEWNKEEFLTVFAKINKQRIKRNDHVEPLPRLYR